MFAVRHMRRTQDARYNKPHTDKRQCKSRLQSCTAELFTAHSALQDMHERYVCRAQLMHAASMRLVICRDFFIVKEYSSLQL